MEPTEKRLERIESRLDALDGYASKLPAYARLVSRFFRLESLIERFQNVVGKTSIQTTRKSTSGDRVLFLCTHNQAAKLREFADTHQNVGNANAKHKTETGEEHEKNRLQANAAPDTGGNADVGIDAGANRRSGAKERGA